MYAARRSELTLVHTAEYPIFGPGNRQVGIEPGIRIAFQDGILRIPLEGKIRTQQGRMVDAGPIREWLDQHPLNGDQDAGFFEVAQAPSPVTEDELTAITMAAASLDSERLEQLLSSERQGWQRPQIMAAISRALETIESIRASVEAEQAEKKTRGK